MQWQPLWSKFCDFDFAAANSEAVYLAAPGDDFTAISPTSHGTFITFYHLLRFHF